ncbi:hypothetical protein BHE74_00019056 [Ensete ventricosum]|nr:hypothetical protein BHE74_00019056 [Ensete ventricosum]
MANIDSVGRVFLTHTRQAHLARVFVMANIVGVGRVFPTKTSHARSTQSLRCGRPRSLTLPWWISRFPIVADLEASLRILGFPTIANPSWQISGFPVLANLEASLTVANFGLSRHNGSQSLTPRWRISSFPAVVNLKASLRNVDFEFLTIAELEASLRRGGFRPHSTVANLKAHSIVVDLKASFHCSES